MEGALLESFPRLSNHTAVNAEEAPANRKQAVNMWSRFSRVTLSRAARALHSDGDETADGLHDTQLCVHTRAHKHAHTLHAAELPSTEIPGGSVRAQPAERALPGEPPAKGTGDPNPPLLAVAQERPQRWGPRSWAEPCATCRVGCGRSQPLRQGSRSGSLPVWAQRTF